MSAIHEYYAALNRLKSNRPEIVTKGSPINKTSVALEAGRKRGSIRNRDGFEQLIKDIEAATGESPKKRSAPDTDKKLFDARAEIEQLKMQNSTLKSRYMSLLYLNLEMSRQMKKHDLKVPKFGGVSDIRLVVKEASDSD
jgi:hypothetical protein